MRLSKWLDRRIAVIAAAVLTAAGGVAAQPPSYPKGIPAIVIVAIDTSSFVGDATREQLMDLATGILETLPPSSEVGLLVFDDEPRFVLDRTSDVTAVRSALDEVSSTSGATVLIDAIHAASLYLRQAPPSRKAVVLVTDGREDGRSESLEQGLQLAQEQQIPIFVVGTGRVAESRLRRIATLTAGTYSSLEEASGFELASYVLDLVPSVAAPAATQLSRPDARVTASSNGLPTVLLAAVVLSLTLATASGAGAIWLWSRRPRPPLPRPGRSSRARVRAAPSASLPAPLDKTRVLPVRPTLEVIEGRNAGGEYTLRDDAATILGRAPASHIVVDEDGVSAEHCRIHPEAGQFVLYDVKSTNGTLVNGSQVSRHILRTGDVIGIGKARLQFRGR